MTELDASSIDLNVDDVQPLNPRTEWSRTHFIQSDEIFESTHMVRLHDMMAETKRQAALSKIALSEAEVERSTNQ